MKKWFCLLLILSLIVPSYPISVAAATPAEYGTTLKDTVLQKSASAKSSIVSRVTKGKKVVLLHKSSTYLKVRFGKSTGYIKTKDIRPIVVSPSVDSVSDISKTFTVKTRPGYQVIVKKEDHRLTDWIKANRDGMIRIQLRSPLTAGDSISLYAKGPFGGTYAVTTTIVKDKKAPVPPKIDSLHEGDALSGKASGDTVKLRFIYGKMETWLSLTSEKSFHADLSILKEGLGITVYAYDLSGNESEPLLVKVGPRKTIPEPPAPLPTPPATIPAPPPASGGQTPPSPSNGGIDLKTKSLFVYTVNQVAKTISGQSNVISEQGVQVVFYAENQSSELARTNLDDGSFTLSYPELSITKDYFIRLEKGASKGNFQKIDAFDSKKQVGLPLDNWSQVPGSPSLQFKVTAIKSIELLPEDPPKKIYRMQVDYEVKNKSARKQTSAAVLQVDGSAVSLLPEDLMASDTIKRSAFFKIYDLPHKSLSVSNPQDIHSNRISIRQPHLPSVQNGNSVKGYASSNRGEVCLRDASFREISCSEEYAYDFNLAGHEDLSIAYLTAGSDQYERFEVLEEIQLLAPPRIEKLNLTDTSVTGQGEPGATITMSLENGDETSTVADAQGRFEINHVDLLGDEIFAQQTLGETIGFKKSYPILREGLIPPTDLSYDVLSQALTGRGTDGATVSLYDEAQQLIEETRVQEGRFTFEHLALAVSSDYFLQTTDEHSSSKKVRLPALEPVLLSPENEWTVIPSYSGLKVKLNHDLNQDLHYEFHNDGTLPSVPLKLKLTDGKKVEREISVPSLNGSTSLSGVISMLHQRYDSPYLDVSSHDDARLIRFKRPLAKLMQLGSSFYAEQSSSFASLILRDATGKAVSVTSRDEEGSLTQMLGDFEANEHYYLTTAKDYYGRYHILDSQIYYGPPQLDQDVIVGDTEIKGHAVPGTIVTAKSTTGTVEAQARVNTDGSFTLHVDQGVQSSLLLSQYPSAKRTVSNVEVFGEHLLVIPKMTKLILHPPTISLENRTLAGVASPNATVSLRDDRMIEVATTASDDEGHYRLVYSLDPREAYYLNSAIDEERSRTIKIPPFQPSFSPPLKDQDTLEFNDAKFLLESLSAEAGGLYRLAFSITASPHESFTVRSKNFEGSYDLGSRPSFDTQLRLENIKNASIIEIINDLTNEFKEFNFTDEPFSTTFASNVLSVSYSSFEQRSVNNLRVFDSSFRLIAEPSFIQEEYTISRSLLTDGETYHLALDEDSFSRPIILQSFTYSSEQ